VPEDAGAEPGRARPRAKRCGGCSSPGACRARGEGPWLRSRCSELRSELEALSQEYQSCLTRLRQCRDELRRSHGGQAQRRRGPCIPLLLAVAAVAIAAFLASYGL
ncbi:hypothetical protein DV515_00016973, partial [Chloebia gouldiae]